ncbi:MAG TPA: molybdopterin-dependent oxidoreductase, partial [Pyrinomonadaceae bacterium]|nr:molybdopterin-dependent oxidoreductase [Pyrinomonadaceae bacterium]
CGNCIEVCPTGTLLDATYRHQARPWELQQTVTTCTYCSDGCQESVGSRAGEVMRVVARDRYVNGHNGEFLCIKGRFAHTFVNDDARLRTPMIRYKKGGKLIPATWDEAIKFAARGLDKAAEAHGANSLAVVGSPRLTNEALYALKKFATELVGTESYTAADAFSLAPFFRNLGGQLATHRDIRHAKTILLISGEPEELQPFAGKQIRQAVRNGGAKLVIVNSTPIRLKEQAAQFLHINPGTEDAAVLAIFNQAQNELAARKMGVSETELIEMRRTITNTEGDAIIMFGGEVSAEAQSLLAQMPHLFNKEGRRVLLHPLPLYNNSVGAHDMGLMDGRLSATAILDMAGSGIRAMYIAGSFLPQQLHGREEAMGKLDFLVVQELFETDTTRYADVVFPAASFAESDGTFTNSGGLVQRVRQTIPPVHQSRQDWVITSQLSKELGVDFNFQMSASAIFKEIAERIPAYAGLRYPLLKDETTPVQVKHATVEQRQLSKEAEDIRARVEKMSDTATKFTETPPIGHELFKIGTLTDKLPQMHLLASGNPRPPTLLVSPLYQITLDESLRREAVAGD